MAKLDGYDGLSFRDQINVLYLPKTFKDEINVYDKWNTLCIEHKLSNPFSPLFKKPALNHELSSEEKIENSHENNKPLNNALGDRAQKIYDEMEEARKQCILFYLQTQFGEDDVEHIHLVSQFGTPSIEEFVRYNKGGPKPNPTKHRCRAMAKVIRYFNENISIEEIENHELMIEYGWDKRKDKTVTSKRFREWMHEENVYDRPPSDRNS